MKIRSVSAQGAHPRSDWALWENEKRVDASYDGNGFSTNFADDLAHIKSLGVDSVRLGIEWAACEPYESKFDRDTFDRYRDIITAAKRCGLDVWLTLVDTTLPGWFGDDMGGFTNRDASAYYFIRYVERCAEYFGDDIAGFTPIEDPVGWALRGYGFGSRPPGHKALRTLAASAATPAGTSAVTSARAPAASSAPATRAASSLYGRRKFYEAVEGALLADHLAARLLGQGRPLTMCVRNTPPVFQLVKDRHSGREADAAGNYARWFDNLFFQSWLKMQTDGVLELGLAPGDRSKSTVKRERVIDSRFSHDFDVIGIGYDHPVGVDGHGSLGAYPQGAVRTDTGFSPLPEQLGVVIERVDSVIGSKEVVLASTGISTTNDQWRCDILGQHLEIAQQLAADNRLGGFFADTAIDGYEMSKGFNTHRGLISRDRKYKPSAQLFRDHIA